MPFEAMAEIEQPVLLIHVGHTDLNPSGVTPLLTTVCSVSQGERSDFSSRKHSEALAAQLRSVEGGAFIYTVKGTVHATASFPFTPSLTKNLLQPPCFKTSVTRWFCLAFPRWSNNGRTGAATFLSIIPTSASIVNRAVKEFINRLPKSRSELNPPEVSVAERMEQALKRLADLGLGSKGPSRLDPMSSLSFSCCSESVRTAQDALLQEYKKDRLYAFNPLGPDGRPKRK